MIFFISDFHFNHRRMLETRPQFKTLDEMNEFIISSFNSKVSQKDCTYFLGDFSWSDPEPFLDRLNGRFIFIKGNHDRRIPDHKKIIYSSNGYYDTCYGEQKFTVCHFAMHSWNCSHYGAWHLYGHHHSKTDFGGKTLNCTVDALDYIPISWDEVEAYMNMRPNNWDLIVRKEVKDESKSMVEH